MNFCGVKFSIIHNSMLRGQYLCSFIYLNVIMLGIYSPIYVLNMLARDTQYREMSRSSKEEDEFTATVKGKTSRLLVSLVD